MSATIFNMPAVGALPRVDWLEVESGATGGTSGKIAIIQDAASATDANGNPTPDTTAFPPANFPPGSLFLPTSYPVGVDGGGMRFRRTGASGSEVWTWIEGSFRASNSNGDYVRSADKTQVCNADLVLAFAQADDCRATWTYPAVFSVAPEVFGTLQLTGRVYGGSPDMLTSAVSDTKTATSVLMMVHRAFGQTDFTTGNSINCAAKAVGYWAA